MTGTPALRSAVLLGAGPRGQRRKQHGRPTLRGWLFIGPVVLGTLLFNVLPILPTIGLSFTAWNGLSAPTWVGIDNYERMLGGGDPIFVQSLTNTMVYTAGYVPAGILAGLGLALLVNNKLPGMAVFRTAFFIPYVTSLVAVGMVARWVFGWQYGVLNWFLGLIGLPEPHWLGEPVSAMGAVIITGVWASVGFNMVILLAGLQNVPEVLMEAAELDGAGPIARFRYVTVPMLTPTIFFLVILQTIGSFQVFALIYVMTGGGPGTGTYVYIYHLWYETFVARNMGYGAALAVLLFAVLGLITWIQLRLSKRWVFYQ